MVWDKLNNGKPTGTDLGDILIIAARIDNIEAGLAGDSGYELTTLDINGGEIDGTPIGANTPSTGAFSSVDIDGGTIDGVSIGSTTPATSIKTTSISSNSTLSLTTASGSDMTLTAASATLNVIGVGMDITAAVNITGDLDVDNININGNTISANNTDGGITIAQNGTGQIAIGSATADTYVSNLIVTNSMQMFDSWDNSSYAVNTVYQATTDSIVTVYFTSLSGGATCEFRTDSSATPTTVRAKMFGLSGSANESMTVPVRKNEYWTVARTSGSDTVSINYLAMGL